MAINKTNLINAVKTRIRTELDAQFTIDPADPNLPKYCQAMATAIVTEIIDHLTANAVVNSTGTEVGGAVTTTGTII